jgi:shikimate dehydrogenase
MDISGKTSVYGVIGDPIEHSLSPVMQNAAFRELKMNSVFLAFNVTSANLCNAVGGMRSLGLKGLNVTMPHKNAIIKYLDDVDKKAGVLGSVNTVLNDHGKLRGFSTDGVGAHRALEENGVSLSGKKIVLLGGGGAAKAIAYSLVPEVEELVILNRTLEKTSAIFEVINGEYPGKIIPGFLSSSEIGANLRDADILVNATIVGMTPNGSKSLVPRDLLNSRLTVMDIVYNPFETKLAREAKAAGAKVISGVEMLVYQGAASFELWTGRLAPVKVMRQAVLN